MSDKTVEHRKASLAAIFSAAGAAVDRVAHHVRGIPVYYVYCNDGYSCHVYESEFVSTSRVGAPLTDNALERIESFCGDLGWAHPKA